jgi:hypothetical protein
MRALKRLALMEFKAMEIFSRRKLIQTKVEKAE